MSITLYSKPSKRASEMKVGEHGYCSARGGIPVSSTVLHPIMIPPMGDCCRVTRVDDETLDVEFVPAVGSLDAIVRNVTALAAAWEFNACACDAPSERGVYKRCARRLRKVLDGGAP